MAYIRPLGYFAAPAAELISGIRAVSLNSSGQLQIAMANNSSRMPAMGVNAATIASGTTAFVYQDREVATSFSGLVGQSVYVGSSGLPTAGTPSLLSGAVQQVIGFKTVSGFVTRI